MNTILKKIAFFVEKFWRYLKKWRRVPIGPICLELSFSRRTKLHSENSFLSYLTNRQFTNKSTGDHFKQFRNFNTLIHSGTLTSEKMCPGVAVIIGVSTHFGYALARRLAQDSFRIVLVSRNVKKLYSLIAEIREKGNEVYAYSCDITHEISVEKLFKKISHNHGIPELVIYGVQSFGPGQTVNVEVPAFEMGWKHNCFGSFLVCRAAASDMLTVAKGTIVIIGSTSSVVGRAGHLNLAVGRFGQRALAQVLSRELWPKGIHVCHILIDADIEQENNINDDFPHSNPNDIAESIIFLHKQPKTAWTSELDIRPWNEAFWEHC